MRTSPTPSGSGAAIDHLVVLAASLEQGVSWCEATLGIAPTAGGEHDKYGTHNKIFKIASPKHPMAYLEIIAINPHAAQRPQVARWFDMDDAALAAAVASAPRLITFVASTPDVRAARHALRVQGIERGQIVHTNRKTNKGTLNWQITVREDGERLFNGCLPTLIQWGKPEATEPLRLHPRNHLPRSGVTLQSLAVSHPSAAKLQAAYESLGLQSLAIETGPANLVATLQTPKGLVQLQSWGV